MQIQGKFLLSGTISKAVIFIEGPPPSADILLNSLVVKHAEKTPPAPAPDFSVSSCPLLHLHFLITNYNVASYCNFYTFKARRTEPKLHRHFHALFKAFILGYFKILYHLVFKTMAFKCTKNYFQAFNWTLLGHIFSI